MLREHRVVESICSSGFWGRCGGKDEKGQTEENLE